MNAPTVENDIIVSFESLLRRRETDGKIVPPFSEDEKALAMSIARAHCYAFTLCEDLPEHASMTSNAGFAWWFALSQICKRRDGRIWV
jgi:hypothetical protein